MHKQANSVSRAGNSYPAIVVQPVFDRFTAASASFGITVHGVSRYWRMYQLLLLAVIMLTVAGISGCASLSDEESAPVTVPEIISMSKLGEPDYRIINRMRDSGTVYRLKASQLANLKTQGVSDNVINYMQRTYLEAVRRHQALEDWNNWSEVDGWWYGGYAWGWPDAWSPYAY